MLGWKKLGYEKRYGALIVNYADDLVICCRHGAEEALAAMYRKAGDEPRAGALMRQYAEG